MSLAVTVGGGERRRADRTQHSFPVWYRSDDGVHRRTRGLDLGRHGARIVIDRPVQGDQELHLTMKVRDGRHVSVVARPIWQERLSWRGEFVVGVAFRPAWTGDRRAIEDSLERSAASVVSSR